jgi:site-specific DNA-cytosine methylase
MTIHDLFAPIGGFNVLSLFDGMSCGQLALRRAGVPYDRYFASEIDKHAIAVTQHNFPRTTQLGDVTRVRGADLPNISLLIGGSPCQGFSSLGDKLNFNDPRSKLFFEFVRLKDELKPEYFLLENVKMKKSHQDVISSYLGVEPVLIDSADFTGAHRNRLYWTNLPIAAWCDRGITVKSILEDNREANSDSWHKWFSENHPKQLGKAYSRIVNDFDKGICQTARQFASWNGNLVRLNDGRFRFLTPVECERLQGVPDNYTSPANRMERYKMLGNGWTIDVIAHIFSSLAVDTCQQAA